MPGVVSAMNMPQSDIGKHRVWPGDVYVPSDQECRKVCAASSRLVTDERLCERIAKARGWKSETIRHLALEGYLGWLDGKLAFVYDTGVKLRWRQNGERIIRWAFGKPWIWRGSFLSIPQRTLIYLTEGETDAISLLDGGVESTDSAALVVAVPSASNFDRKWAPHFSGKDVLIYFDGDHAGDAATERVGNELQPYARKLMRLDWEGVRRAS
jgi:hypothetical protein